MASRAEPVAGKRHAARQAPDDLRGQTVSGGALRRVRLRHPPQEDAVLLHDEALLRGEGEVLAGRLSSSAGRDRLRRLRGSRYCRRHRRLSQNLHAARNSRRGPRRSAGSPRPRPGRIWRRRPVERIDFVADEAGDHGGRSLNCLKERVVAPPGRECFGRDRIVRPSWAPWSAAAQAASLNAGRARRRTAPRPPAATTMPSAPSSAPSSISKARKRARSTGPGRSSVLVSAASKPKRA